MPHSLLLHGLHLSTNAETHSYRNSTPVLLPQMLIDPVEAPIPALSPVWHSHLHPTLPAAGGSRQSLLPALAAGQHRGLREDVKGEEGGSDGRYEGSKKNFSGRNLCYGQENLGEMEAVGAVGLSSMMRTQGSVE